MPAKIAFLPSEADYISASRAAYRCQLRGNRVWRRLLVLAAGVGAVIAAVLWLVFGNLVEALGTGLLAGVCGFLAAPVGLAITYLTLPRRARRLFHQQRPLHAEQILSWDDTHLHWQGPGFVLNTPWRDYHRWHETGAEFLLFLNEQLPQFIPLRALDAEQADDLRATLVAHGPPRR